LTHVFFPKSFLHTNRGFGVGGTRRSSKTDFFNFGSDAKLEQRKNKLFFQVGRNWRQHGSQ
jgi:hypothetical protein